MFRGRQHQQPSLWLQKKEAERRPPWWWWWQLLDAILQDSVCFFDCVHVVVGLLDVFLGVAVATSVVVATKQRSLSIVCGTVHLGEPHSIRRRAVLESGLTHSLRT